MKNYTVDGNTFCVEESLDENSRFIPFSVYKLAEEIYSIYIETSLRTANAVSNFPQAKQDLASLIHNKIIFPPKIYMVKTLYHATNISLLTAKAAIEIVEKEFLDSLLKRS